MFDIEHDFLKLPLLQAQHDQKLNELCVGTGEVQYFYNLLPTYEDQ